MPVLRVSSIRKNEAKGITYFILDTLEIRPIAQIEDLHYIYKASIDFDTLNTHAISDGVDARVSP